MTLGASLAHLVLPLILVAGKAEVARPFHRGVRRICTTAAPAATGAVDLYGMRLFRYRLVAGHAAITDLVMLVVTEASLTVKKRVRRDTYAVVSALGRFAPPREAIRPTARSAFPSTAS